MTDTLPGQRDPAAAASRFDDWSLDPADTHLNHGSFGAVPRVTQAVQQELRAQLEGNPSEFMWRTLPPAMNAARERVAAFVGAEAARTVLTPNVTTGIAHVLASVPLARGDQVVVTDDTYSGVRLAVAARCAAVGAEMVVASLGDDAHDAGAYANAVVAAVTPATRLVIADHVTATTALHIDVAALVARLRAASQTLVCVDGAHAAGAIPLDVNDVAADFYIGTFHKWGCSPRGSAFLTAGPSAPQVLSAIVGSRVDEGFPQGLEWLGTTDVTAPLATWRSLDFLEERGLAALRMRNAALANDGAGRVAEALSLAIPPRSDLPMVALEVPVAPSAASRLRDLLADEGIAAAVTETRGRVLLRLSAHLYTAPEDFDVVTTLLGARLASLSGIPSKA